MYWIMQLGNFFSWKFIQSSKKLKSFFFLNWSKSFINIYSQLFKLFNQKYGNHNNFLNQTNANIQRNEIVLALGEMPLSDFWAQITQFRYIHLFRGAELWWKSLNNVHVYSIITSNHLKASYHEINYCVFISLQFVFCTHLYLYYYKLVVVFFKENSRPF